MTNWLVWPLALVAMAGAENAGTRELLVTVTPRATAVRAERTEFGLVPYVLRVEGLRLPGDRNSRLTIYGEAPSKEAPVLGTAEGMSWRGGPKLNPPRNFVIPLNQEAQRYLAGRQQVKLWVRYEGMTELRFGNMAVDISVAK